MEEKKKVLILSNAAQKRLSEEFEKRGWEAVVHDPKDFYCYLSNQPGGFDRLYLKGPERGQRIKMSEFSAVVPRISGSGFRYGLLVLEHLSKNLKVFSTASVFGLGTCSNKFETCQFLSQNKIRVPTQVLAHGLTDYAEAIKLVGGLPVIAKLQKGSQGAGVFLLRDEIEASQSLRALRYATNDLVLSQKLDSGKPASDLRIWVIGAFLDEPKIIAYRRYALDSDFRSNYSLSGSGEKVDITPEEKQMAIDSARALRMHVAGVDIMRNKPQDDRPYLIEVNGNPGLQGVSAVTGENVAGEVAQFVVDNWNKKDMKLRSISDLMNDVIEDAQKAVTGKDYSKMLKVLTTLKFSLRGPILNDPVIRGLI